MLQFSSDYGKALFFDLCRHHLPKWLLQADDLIDPPHIKTAPQCIRQNIELSLPVLLVGFLLPLPIWKLLPLTQHSDKGTAECLFIKYPMQIGTCHIPADTAILFSLKDQKGLCSFLQDTLPHMDLIAFYFFL